jgi:glutathionyl-hydroquinone reductase
MSKALRNQGLASRLLEQVEEIARSSNKSGLCTMSSEGPWMVDRRLFEKNGFVKVDERGRFQLLAKTWDENAGIPILNDWEDEAKAYKGWHLVYADQCPWHNKAVVELRKTGLEFGIDLAVTKLESATEAQHAPSGFGTFSLLKDGKLLEDHYISATRFRNILKKEL